MGVEKIVLDNSDFKFKVAYDLYEKAFDTAESDEKKTQLNEKLNELNEGNISYPSFYQSLRDDDDTKRFHRSKISGERKFAYRKKQQKSLRIARHK